MIAYILLHVFTKDSFLAVVDRIIRPGFQQLAFGEGSILFRKNPIKPGWTWAIALFTGLLAFLRSTLQLLFVALPDIFAGRSSGSGS
jgi:hypothetical protein